MIAVYEILRSRLLQLHLSVSHLPSTYVSHLPSKYLESRPLSKIVLSIIDVDREVHEQVVTLYYQLCVNSEIYTDFVQVSPLNCGSTSLDHDHTDLFSPLSKAKRLNTQLKFVLAYVLH